MPTIESGIINDKKVETKIFSSLEKGKMQRVNSIVLHRTASSSATSVLNGYSNGQQVGAHFLIDKEGHIYQTAKVSHRCWHVGILFSRCRKEKVCSPDALKSVKSILFEKDKNYSKRVRNLSNHEKKKGYPARYPTNNDSIGIEVVGSFIGPKKRFETPTQKQLQATKWLVSLLVKEFNINLRNDVYAHGTIAHKEPSEGVQLLKHVMSGASA